MQTGLLNWIYPKALYIDTAVWRAQLAGRIGTDPPLQTTNKLFINPGYRKAIRTLRDFADRFSGAAGPQRKHSVVVLLMEAMLWSRISVERGAAGLAPHISAPTDQEAVLITQRVVLAAITQGRITPKQAIALGLMRLYGSDDAIADATELLERPIRSAITGVASQ